MNWFYNLKIGTKLLSSFLVVASIVGIVGWVGYSGMGAVMKNADEMFEHRLIPMRDLGYANAALLIARADMLALINAPTQEKKNAYLASLKEQTDKVNELIAMFEKNDLNKEDKEMLAAFQENWTKYIPLREQAINHAMESRNDEALKILYGEALSPLVNSRKSLRALIDHSAKVAQELAEDSDKDQASAENQILIFIALGIVSSIGLGLFVARIIVSPVREVIANIDSADLNSQFNSSRKDEVGELQRSFDKFVTSIKETLLQVAESASAVASASTEISSSTEQMAAGAQEQTSQAAEVASAVEEMTKTIVENSRNATDTATTAKDAKEAARRGGNVVEETVSGMKKIADVVRHSAETVQALGKSSDQIGEIVSVINDIADQTNLLALNAAIEAARAGDQGRGFAVVADEVRKLAERTSKATQEIASMIKKIQIDTKGAVTSMELGTKQVDEGIKLADQAGASLQEIVGISQKVTDMVTQIAAASEEQSSASEQISKNVEAISSVTNESATGVQQIAHAAEDLNRLTENLTNLVSKFKLSERSRSLAGVQTATATRNQKHVGVPKSRFAIRENGSLIAQE